MRWRPICWPEPGHGQRGACRGRPAPTPSSASPCAAALASVDAGQAVVVADGQVLAIEGAEGTDAMLRAGGRACPAAMRPAGGAASWPKGPSPARSCASTCRPSDRAPSSRPRPQASPAWWSRPVPCWCSTAPRRPASPTRAAAPSTASPACASQHSAMAARRRIGRVIGRLRPRRRDAEDIERGLAAVECLAPFATGSGAVVVRHDVRAIEAAEGANAMLERAAALRRQCRDRLVREQRHAHHLGHRLPRDVVVRRAQAAADDHRIGAAHARRSASTIRAMLSPTFTWWCEAMPDDGELLADPGRVGVDDLAEQQLGPDCDHLTRRHPADPPDLGDRRLRDARQLLRGRPAAPAGGSARRTRR